MPRFPGIPFCAKYEREKERERERERERVRGCRMQQNLKSFPPPPPAIPKGESDLRARGLKSGYLRYQAFDAETGVTTSAARHERRGEAKRGEAKRDETGRSEARQGEARRGEERRGAVRRLALAIIRG